MSDGRLPVTLPENAARPRRSGPARIGRGALSMAAFVVALAVTAHFIGGIDRFAGVVELEEKFAWFDAHADEYDTLFVGTSRVYRGIMPEIFDRRMAGAGMSAKSFNFGIDGMFAPEDSFVLEHILARKPKNLRRVFIELGMFQTNLDERDPYSIRSAYWHDWTRTRLVIRNLLISKNGEIRWSRLLFGDADERERLQRAAVHLGVCITHSLAVGHGIRWLAAPANPLAEPSHRAMIGPAGDGFVAMDPAKMMSDAEREKYDAYLKKLRSKAPRITRVNPQSQRNLELIAGAIRRAGARPYFVVSPVPNRESRHPREDLDAPVLDFSNVHTSGEILLSKFRIDGAHLSEEGAALYTEEFSRRFIALVRSESPSP